MELYHYTPFVSPSSQIRLLKLLPGLGQIQCRLTVVELASHRNGYEPISYCWRKYENNRTEKNVAVSISGVDFLIRENLYDALSQMRRAAEPRIIWADAICINQQDPVEKSHQVPLMAQIYRNGLRTLVWLGQADRWTKMAFDAFKNGTRLMYGSSGHLYEGTPPEQDLTSDNTRMAIRSDRLLAYTRLFLRARCDLRLYKAVDSVLGRQYFKRAWVVQEVVLSQHVVIMCGRLEMDWDIIYRWLDRFQHDFFGKSIFFGIFLRVRDLRGQPVQESPCPLPKIMATLSPTQATDPRDKLYSVLGLVTNQSKANPITVDYTMDWGSVFSDFTKKCLLSTTKLHALCMGLGTGTGSWSHQGKVRTPSWAWNPQPSYPYDRFTWDNPVSSPAFRTAHESTSILDFKDNLMGVQGYVWDTITMIGPIGLITDPPKTLASIFRTSIKASEILKHYFVCRALAGLDDTSASTAILRHRRHILNRTLDPYGHTDEAAGSTRTFEAFDFAMCQRFSRDVHRAKRRTNLYARLKVWIAPLGMSWQNANGDPNARLLASYTPKEGAGLGGRRVTCTSRGSLGLCPKDTRANDKVVILRGSDVPYVFRQTNNHWNLVGECYVHEVMYGEHWDETRCEMLWVA